MTDFLQPTDEQPTIHVSSQPLRRPGWGLIHDVHARQTPHSVALTQPESRTQTVTKPILPASTSTTPKPAAPNRRALRWAKRHIVLVSTPIIVIASIRLSAAPIVGEILICAYGLTALILRLPSRVSFWLATTVLASIGLEFIILPQASRVNNGALFVFLLLAIGLISGTLETRRMTKQEKAFRVDNTTLILSGKNRG